MQKLRLEQKLQQKLSPQQIQVIKLLESTTLELEEKIKQELEENPALEESDEHIDNEINNNGEETEDLSLGDYRDEDDIPPYKLETNNRTTGEKKEDIPFSAGITFHESLIDQIALRDLSKNQFLIAEYIIGNIDDEGYLRRDLQSISDDLIFQVNMDVSVGELEDILRVVQDLEPTGVGARTLQECLLIQLRKQEETGDSNLAITLIQNHFDEFAYKHYDKIARELNISEARLKAVIQKITTLNPKPGNAFSTPLENRKETIIPDFIVEYHNGQLHISLNHKNVPELKINPEFSSLLQDSSLNKAQLSANEKDATIFIKQKLDSAKWFIDALKQRQNTLLSTMNAIVSFQQDFFKDGDEASLRPMILKDIAEMTGFDISTISRVSNSKYVQTNFGVYSLKYFFSEAMQREDGEEISSREIKKIIQECIANENKKKPLTDEQLTEVLKQKSYVIARRTVAKYREQLNIPVARLRKEI
ncbi:MAG: RNA polymerase factor sigma-54 [Candidatus Azobacteroides sp.]|nr:RNA polymerase factor sigma-54 [Candidatus Azobacteroides sp.]